MQKSGPPGSTFPSPDLEFHDRTLDSQYYNRSLFKKMLFLRTFYLKNPERNVSWFPQNY